MAKKPHTPCPVTPINSDLVDAFITAQGNKATTVIYAKVDGTLSSNNGLPKVYVRRVNNEKGKVQAARMADTGQRFFDFPKPKVSSSGRTIPGFSFFNTRVMEVRAGKAVLSAKDYEPAMLARDLAKKEAARNA